ncbi:helix-turn-helix transcriptional regulator [Chromobacterium haemolyticum]|uniref:Helix-turn-helix transcriptional regulator n=1 Tax=Chromobacterium haemolyticum TaxID=394935 RepID=A0ABS3GLE0_9NEIS|nr:helix-turn-helix transcriptional regulator [Chromobacterium haemolyticum]MBK0415507.1 helix-turn-helix transcriptional regulator [Chromobacterium haemolyticum]MBO0415073.1 helix-turn-helix transcriptional regulator [Chromobacterium haemolyticum]MBO0498334.1 helix-turn-helix transcriptional regulator [Chromobacterium haemolyticum]
MADFDHLHDYDGGAAPVVGKARDYAAGGVSPRHAHPTAQLLYAVEGVMMVTTDQGRWIVPPTRGIWLPIATWHQVNMLSRVRMRTAYVRGDALAGLPAECCVLAVSPLLRELIQAATGIAVPYPPDSRAERVMRLILDEIRSLPSLALSLPQPASAALDQLCRQLLSHPGDARGVAEWAAQAAMDPRTLQRRFQRETGLSFGQWRRQARLIAALERLARGASVLEVALDLGYASPSAFSTMFKRELGASPSAFFDALQL